MRIDFLYHLIAGFIIVTLLDTFIPIWITFIIGCAVGILKEIYDKYVRKTIFDWRDMCCTFAGSFFGCWLDYVKTLM